MEPVKLEATTRTASGKGVSRRLRASGKIPAVAYGKKLASTHIAVSPKALTEVLTGAYGKNTIVNIDIEGKQQVHALLGEYQVHPVTRELLHADFVEIRDDEPVNVDVPFEAVGRSKGVVLGGTLREIFRALPVRCLPKDIPVKLTHDVSDVGVDEAVSADKLTLPEGVEVRLRPTQTVVAVVGEKRRGGEEEGKEGEGAEKADAKAAKPS